MAQLILYSDPGHLIRRLQQIAVAIFSEEVGANGITPLQYGAMVAIRETPDLDITRLSYLLGQDRSTMGDAVKRMRAKGWVTTSAVRGDKRAQSVRITAKGRGVLKKVEPAVATVHARILAPIEPKERELLLDILFRLVGHNNSFSRAPIRDLEGAIASVAAAPRKTRPRTARSKR